MRIKITLVDDHPFMLSGMRQILSAFPNLDIIHSFSNANDLINELKENRTIPDVAIIDLQMPEIDGFELTKILKNKYPEINIIIYSFNTESFIVQKAIHLGASAFLSKNEDPIEMQKAITTVALNKTYYNNLVNKDTIAAIKKGNSSNSRFKINTEITKREKEVIIHICNSKTYKEIAETMNISKRTVETHKERTFKKLGVSKINDLIIYAAKMGWT